MQNPVETGKNILHQYGLIKKSISQRCTPCGKYIKGDPIEHLKQFHGGQGSIETVGTVDYANHALQVPTIPNPAPSTLPLEKPTIPSPFMQQYGGEMRPLQNQFQQSGWSFQHPVIVQMQRDVDRMAVGYNEETARLQQRGVSIQEAQRKVNEADELYRKTGGMMQPIHPDSFEAWKAAFIEITGFNIGWWTLFMIGVVLYAVVIFSGVHNKVANIFVPMVSSHGRRLLEERGQYVTNPQEYETLTRAEWRNVHQALQMLDSQGNEKIVEEKLMIKTKLMENFQNSTLDSVYILLHKATDSIEQCRGLASIGKPDKNAFTEAFTRCISSRLF